MAAVGSGFDVPEYDAHDPSRSAGDSPFRGWLVGDLDNPQAESDDYDPAWRTRDTPFRRWLVAGLIAAGSDLPAEAVSCFAPADRYRGLSRENAELFAVLTDTTVVRVRAAHKVDLRDRARERELRDHSDLAVLDAGLDRIRDHS
ncbi:hypothetical protein [Embleya sp. NPDC001921]